MVPQKTYDGMLATPVEVDDIVAGEMLWCATKGCISGSTILLVASLLGAVADVQALFCIPILFLVGLAFAGTAIAVSAVSPSYDFFSYYPHPGDHADVHPVRACSIRSRRFRRLPSTPCRRCRSRTPLP